MKLIPDFLLFPGLNKPVNDITNDITNEVTEAMFSIAKLLEHRTAPVSLNTIIKDLPDHREDAVRLAFWALVQQGEIKLNKQYRAKLA